MKNREMQEFIDWSIQASHDCEMAELEVSKMKSSAVIRAEAWSDCQQFRIEFDATLWAEQATDKALIDLGQCGCRGDYPADAVVEYMAKHDQKAASLFEFIQVVRYQINGDTNGFECAVDEDDLRKWLQQNKPHLVEQVFSGLYYE